MLRPTADPPHSLTLPLQPRPHSSSQRSMCSANPLASWSDSAHLWQTAIYVTMTNVSEQLSAVLFVGASCSIDSLALTFWRGKSVFKPLTSTPKITFLGIKMARGSNNDHKVLTGEVAKRYPWLFWKILEWLSGTTLSQAVCSFSSPTAYQSLRKINV